MISTEPLSVMPVEVAVADAIVAGVGTTRLSAQPGVCTALLMFKSDLKHEREKRGRHKKARAGCGLFLKHPRKNVAVDLFLPLYFIYICMY
jgi:hypothetical protein